MQWMGEFLDKLCNRLLRKLFYGTIIQCNIYGSFLMRLFQELRLLESRDDLLLESDESFSISSLLEDSGRNRDFRCFFVPTRPVVVAGVTPQGPSGVGETTGLSSV